MEPITIRYRASRRDVWNWYWISWRRGLWRFWMLAGAASFAAALLAVAATRPLKSADIAAAGSFVAVLWAAFAAYPQLAFKPAARTLTVGPDGIDTQIGTKSAHRNWKEIGPIAEMQNNIVIPIIKSKNAFLVPESAFQSVDQRGEFLTRSRAWQTATMVDAD